MLPWRGSKQSVAAPLAATGLLLLICHGIRGQPLSGEEVVVTIDDIQRLGEAKLDGPTRSYIGNGVGAERTLRDNREAFTRLRFRPQSLVDVSKTNTATTVLGSRISFPIGFSPSAAHMMADPAGEFGTAQAARDAGTVMILSAMSTTSLEDLRARVPDCILWQQTYIFRNRSLTQSLVRRAAAQGFGAIVVTVDSPVTGQDMGLQNNMFRLPPGLRFANLEASSPGRSFTFDPTSPDFVGSLLSPAATWEDIRWLRTITKLPIVVKGVLTAESARRALEYGAAGVLVSNHGGRQLDGDVASLDALPEVVAAVGNRMEVYLDSGVRSGADAVKALSLGARAVFVGRPAIWGLAYNGKQGVDKVLDILRSGLIRTIQLLGCPDSNDLRAEYVSSQAYNAQPLSSSNWKPRDPVIDWIDTQVGF